VEKTLGDGEAKIARLPPEGAKRYGAMWRTFTRRACERERDGSPPEVVARAVHHALTAEPPRTRYVVGKNARALTLLSRIMPDRWLDAMRNRIFSLPATAAE
jgi:hypothetical protein